MLGLQALRQFPRSRLPVTVVSREFEPTPVPFAFIVIWLSEFKDLVEDPLGIYDHDEILLELIEW